MGEGIDPESPDIDAGMRVDWLKAASRRWPRAGSKSEKRLPVWCQLRPAWPVTEVLIGRSYSRADSPLPLRVVRQRVAVKPPTDGRGVAGQMGIDVGAFGVKGQATAGVQSRSELDAFADRLSAVGVDSEAEICASNWIFFQSIRKPATSSESR